VVGPENPIQVFTGADIVFLCFLSPETNAEATEMHFCKDCFSDIVHLYQDGEDEKYMQMSGFQGRTELVKDFIVDGHVLLRLEKVISSDAGLVQLSDSRAEGHLGTSGNRSVANFREFMTDLFCRIILAFINSSMKGKIFSYVTFLAVLCDHFVMSCA
jgi:hypothetical protein